MAVVELVERLAATAGGLLRQIFGVRSAAHAVRGGAVHLPDVLVVDA
jgi:hypothetical protein